MILRGATVVDGTGGPARVADVCTDGDRIADAPVRGDREIDALGLVCVPGFVDTHTRTTTVPCCAGPACRSSSRRA